MDLLRAKGPVDPAIGLRGAVIQQSFSRLSSSHLYSVRLAGALAWVMLPELSCVYVVVPVPASLAVKIWLATSYAYVVRAPLSVCARRLPTESCVYVTAKPFVPVRIS